jgi:hypothetical protein
MATIEQSLKTVDKVNNKFLDILDNQFVKYGFLIFVVLRIIFITDMDDYYLNMSNRPVIKIISALFIAYAACFDPVYAIALTTLIIITMQEGYRRQAGKTTHSAIDSSRPFNSTTLLDSSVGTSLQLPADTKILQKQSVSLDQMPEKALLIKDAMVYNEINKHALQRVPDPKDTMIAEFDFYEDPAYRTITANLTGKDYLGRNQFIITENNMAQIQTNQEPNVDQNVAVQAFPKVLNIQGLPNGFDKGVGGANLQLASIDGSC